MVFQALAVFDGVGTNTDHRTDPGSGHVLITAIDKKTLDEWYAEIRKRHTYITRSDEAGKWFVYNRKYFVIEQSLNQATPEFHGRIIFTVLPGGNSRRGRKGVWFPIFGNWE
ncbi:hypothetical protein BDW59DRAFT_157384 [Aspergillus cavernicola]|uniref:PH domain-containing protein n=1 Tax=Aspergillus cavernicola TaxID=176166 RepID=A0ABR4IXR3_9EURO